MTFAAAFCVATILLSAFVVYQRERDHRSAVDAWCEAFCSQTHRWARLAAGLALEKRELLAARDYWHERAMRAESAGEDQ